MSINKWLEWAAKAAGIDMYWEADWSPLTDDGDALRLAAKLHLDIQHHEDGGVWFVAVDSPALLGHLEVESYDDTDAAQALRCAIVRCAAQVGKGMSAEG